MCGSEDITRFEGLRTGWPANDTNNMIGIATLNNAVRDKLRHSCNIRGPYSRTRNQDKQLKMMRQRLKFIDLILRQERRPHIRTFNCKGIGTTIKTKPKNNRD